MMGVLISFMAVIFLWFNTDPHISSSLGGGGCSNDEKQNTVRIPENVNIKIDVCDARQRFHKPHNNREAERRHSRTSSQSSGATVKVQHLSLAHLLSRALLLTRPPTFEFSHGRDCPILA